MFTGAATLCNACARSAAEGAEIQRLERENEESRTPARGACRVRDVKKRYGHTCEIPLHCYQIVGVASRLSDYVTEADVEAASNYWDGEGALYDIDTQWGSMPYGGAYSDSRHYPGNPGDDYTDGW
jgi:hypothetical protein